MGNTIRREPVTNKIPNAPDYRFLNIMNFKGLNITDNPFNVDYNTASDMLNVYIDEQNALTTRPRVEMELDLQQLLGGDYALQKFIGVYNTSKGILVHTLQTIEDVYVNRPRLFLIKNDNSVTWIQDNNQNILCPSEKCVVFENDSKVYLLYKDKYLCFDDEYILCNVEGYIPTLRQGVNEVMSVTDSSTGEVTTEINVNGTKFEDLNILTNKYKETYFWDGTWNPSDLTSNSLDDVENNYIQQIVKRKQTNPYYIVKYLPEKDRFLLLKNQKLYFGSYDLSSDDYDFKDLEEISMPNDLQLTNYSSSVYDIDASNDGEYIAILCVATDSTKSDYLYVLRGSSGWKRAHEWDADLGYHIRIGDYDGQRVTISKDGNTVIVNDGNDFNIFKYNETNNEYDYRYHNIIHYFSVKSIKFMIASDNADSAILVYEDTSGEYKIVFYKHLLSFDVDNDDFPTDYQKIIVHKYFPGYKFSDDGTKLVLIDGENNVLLYDDYLKSDEYEILMSSSQMTQVTSDKYMEIGFAFTPDKNKIYFWTNKVLGWIILKDKVVIRVQPEYPSPQTFKAYATDSFLYLMNYNINYAFFACSMNYDSRFPNLILTRTLQETDTEYTTWLKKRELFFNNKQLTTRFNNERWFSSNNMIFRTAYNNPNYIPLYDNSSLGNDTEPVTGLNVVQDNVLIVYKDDKIHSITYGEIGDNIYGYIYAESQNTTGNNAIGGVITTTLTELPLQISYSGIFVLRQAHNISTSSRIIESISEPIDKKWLKEDKNSIKNAKTINRLYWTYVILDGKDGAGENTFTKVYLLDNRTTQWFYWELPFVIVDVFTKDNQTILVDNEGRFYILKTTDIVNTYNPDYTEYYDEGKIPIEWFWKSQILSMGTINYSKKLVSTTFILTDTDEKDEYGLNYKFKVFRKTANETAETTLTNDINYIVSTTKRTLVPRYNFLQLELSNIEEDTNNNKLRLVGLGLKYVLLEGLT